VFLLFSPDKLGFNREELECSMLEARKWMDSTSFDYFSLLNLLFIFQPGMMMPVGFHLFKVDATTNNHIIYISILYIMLGSMVPCRFQPAEKIGF
jgi:hypothetical protein